MYRPHICVHVDFQLMLIKINQPVFNVKVKLQKICGQKNNDISEDGLTLRVGRTARDRN